MSKGSTRLSFTQKFKVLDWLKTNLESLDAEKTTYVDAAARAQKALGFPVTGKIIENLCRDSGVSWSHILRHPSSKVISQLDSLSEMVSALSRRIEMLEKALL